MWGRRYRATVTFPTSATVDVHYIQQGWSHSQERFSCSSAENTSVFLTRDNESTVKIFEQSIQTPCGSYRRQAAREQLLRMGNEEMATTPRQFTVFFLLFFVIGCQNGFDLLRDLLIINCIICFLLRSGQEKQTRTHHQRPGQISYHQRG